MKHLLLLISFSSLAAPVFGQDQVVPAPLADAMPNEATLVPIAPALDHYQSKTALASPEWFALEALRTRLYQRQGQWAEIVARSKRWPIPLPQALEQVLLTSVVTANLQVNEPVKAREPLLRLLWRTNDTSPLAVMDWRREVIRSYLMEGRNDDAQTATQRYLQDYHDESLAWRILQAEVLLSRGEYADIPQLLEAIADPQAQLLDLIAKYLAYTTVGSAVLPTKFSHALEKEAVQFALGYLESEPLAAFQFAALAANIAQLRKDYASEVANLEMALSIKEQAIGRLKVEVEPNRLWFAYGNYALELGNQAQLIVGDFDRWISLANEWRSAKPLQARALLAFVMNRAQEPLLRAAAHDAFIAALAQVDKAEAILIQLYLSPLKR